MHKQSRTTGIIISYLAIAVRSFSQFFLTSIYLKYLGLNGYGFYQYIYSIASCAIILDFGISSAVNKFSIEFREKNDEEGVQNSLFLCLMMTFASALIIGIAGIILIHYINVVFGNLSEDQFVLTKRLLMIIVLYFVVLLFQHYFEGILLSNEQYVTFRLIGLFQIITKVCIVLSLLFSNWGAISIAISDLTASFIFLIISIAYSIFYLKVRIRFYYLDMNMLKEAAKLASALCLQSVILYTNSNVGKYLLGRLLNSGAVAIYTITMHFSNFFDEIPTIIQRMYLPQAVKLVANNADGETLTDFIIRPGRFQFILCGGVLGGFILFGKDFILLWIGEEAIIAWEMTALLITSSVIPLIQNVSLTILTAKNKRMFRSYMLCFVAFVNFFLTIFLVKKIGILGAIYGSIIAVIFGNILAMNWYYKYRIGINIERLFTSIFRGILPSIVVATLLSSILLLFPIKLSWLWFFCKCFFFVLIYGVLLWLYGLNCAEKLAIKQYIHF